MIDRIYASNFYGDSTRWFIGIVENNNDPMQLGRVQVRIYGIHTMEQSDIETGDLPWAQTIVPTTEGGVSGIGRSPQLQAGAMVIGMFLDAQASQLPMVIGSIPRVESVSSVQQSIEGSNSLYTPSNTPSSTGPGTGPSGVRNQLRAEQDFSTVEGSTNTEIAFNYFVEYGFTPQQAAGIVGNLMRESGPGLDTSIKAAGSEQSFGIAQWNAAAGRFQQLKEFAGNMGRDWTDLEVQLQFIIWELENVPSLGLADLRAAKTIEEATFAFEGKYERPAHRNDQQRVKFAKDVYNRMMS